VAANVAWVFPGQGAQETGMGRDLYDRYASARELFDRADAILNRSISKLCFAGGAELDQTANAQPAIYTMSLACLAAAKDAGAVFDEPACVAGHSLGEYTALAAAGALDFEAGLRLVEERGRLTQAAAEATPGAMAAILGLDEEAVRAVCADTGAELCNLNAPGQIVIGGKKEAVSRACALATERGARRAVTLDVSGAFHSSLMLPAVDPFAQAVSSAQLRAPRVALIANKTASAMTDPVEIAEELVYQLTHPVRWVECVARMEALGVTSIIEFGPGRVLTGLVKRIAPAMELTNVNSVPSIEKLAACST
jgi:[acyl-carrier-protein] S-malonyltransferase